ncbi:MAG: hypothetical protein KDA21_03300 [Phycisphaerales bacterium]|nr:hypothetical protein [Phycisphaerales bacterium]
MIDLAAAILIASSLLAPVDVGDVGGTADDIDATDPDIMPGTPVEIGQAIAAEAFTPDEIGDATLRRTDPVNGSPNPIPGTRNLPDLRTVRIVGWSPTDATTGNIYNGNTAPFDDAPPDFVRIDMVFTGLLNPPGTLGVNSLTFDPTKWGPHPLYGFLELDIDHNHNTGGEIGGGAELKYLANVGRFGNVPPAPLAARAAVGGPQIDLNFNSPPFYERSGADWEIALCGCTALTKVAEPSGDGDTTFEEGETWILNGRIFQRTAGYANGSLAFGGSAPGLYDPLVDLRFYHYNPAGTANDRTIVTIVYPLTMAGAAALANQPLQPANADPSDHNAIEESLIDIIAGADSGQLFGENLILQQGWAGQDPSVGLDPANWRATALFGTSYPDTRPFFFAWTDVAFQTWADLNGDEEANPADRTLIDNRIADLDGTGRDDDGTVDGIVTIPNFGPNFYVEDINGDGLIDGTDRNHPVFIPPPNPGDVNNDGIVDFTDLNIILSNWGSAGTSITHDDGDLDGNGVVDFTDLNEVLANWGTTYP